jgi:Zn-dependent protease with chaperone function
MEMVVAILTEEQFIALVRRAEMDAQTNLSRYKLKVALFALLGYGVIFALLALLISLVGGTVFVAVSSAALLLLLIKKKLIFGIAIAIWILFKALWVRFQRPQGHELCREKYPLLFNEIDALTRELKSLKIHKVIINPDLNASVVQFGRMGMFGWNENTLVLGLQLMMTLSVEEMRSVLAHEFGHLSGNHSRFSGWIYRARISWGNVMDGFANTSSWGGKILARFFNWYVPRFSAYSFALARNNEYEADAISAKLTSPEIATKALVNVYATAPYIEQEYWDNYYKQADDHAKPLHKPYDGLQKFMQTSTLEKQDMLARIKNEMQHKTHYADTHPSLKDRVAALNAKPVLPVAPQVSAAQALLGDKLSQVMDAFDKNWIGDNEERWSNRHQHVQDANKAFDELGKLAMDELKDEQLWKLASITHEFKPEQHAKPFYQAYLARYPQDVDAAFYIGGILYRESSDTCMEYLSIAIKGARYTEEAGRMGYQFLNAQKKPLSAEEWWDKVMAQDSIHRAAEAERSSLYSQDKFIPIYDGHRHNAEKMILKAKNLLFNNNQIKGAWIACKQLEHDADYPVYVIAIKGKGIKRNQDKLETSIVNALAEFDAQYFVVSLNGECKDFAKQVKQVGRQLI